MDLENPFPGGIQHFKPPHCPHADCPSRVPGGQPFRYRSRGRFQRRCDRRVVRRFHCHVCRRSFSVQTFRVDYRLHRPELTAPLFDTFVSKVTQRQAARTLGCTRKTVRHRLLLLAQHSQEFHTAALVRAPSRGALAGPFQLDELETFERDRRLRPVTMPLLLEEPSRFIVHVEVAPLPSRGGLSKKHQKRRREMEALEGVRRSGSREAVKHCFERLASVLRPGALVIIRTDMKSSYVTLLAEVMPGPYRHERTSGKEPKDEQNPLWVINHTQAMCRDAASRLVRRSWGVSKERAWLELHAWVWVAYRNYIRGFTNKKKRVTAAQLAGVVDRRYTKHSFFEWRVLDTA